MSWNAIWQNSIWTALLLERGFPHINSLEFSLVENPLNWLQPNVKQFSPILAATTGKYVKCTVFVPVWHWLLVTVLFYYWSLYCTVWHRLLVTEQLSHIHHAHIISESLKVFHQFFWGVNVCHMYFGPPDYHDSILTEENPSLFCFFARSRWVCSATVGVNVIRLQVLSVCSGSLPMIGWIGPDQTAIYPLLLLGRHHPPTPTYCIIITLPPTYLRTYGSAICGMEGDFSPTEHIFITVVSFLNTEQAQTEESRRDVIRYSIPPHIAVWCVW